MELIDIWTKSRNVSDTIELNCFWLVPKGTSKYY